MHEVYSAAYGTVHNEEPSNSCEIRVGHSPGSGLPSVAILPWLCRKRGKAIFTHSCSSFYECYSRLTLTCWWTTWERTRVLAMPCSRGVTPWWWRHGSGSAIWTPSWPVRVWITCLPSGSAVNPWLTGHIDISLIRTPTTSSGERQACPSRRFVRQYPRKPRSTTSSAWKLIIYLFTLRLNIYKSWCLLQSFYSQ